MPKAPCGAACPHVAEPHGDGEGVFRAGTEADLPAITAVRTAVRENHLSVEQMAEVGITHQSLAARMAGGDLGCWVAEAAGNIVGFAMADRLKGEIFALFIHPDHEGKGHGSTLLAQCEDWLKRHGHAIARLNTEQGTRAFTFYSRKGWRPTGEKSGLFAEDDMMEKRLEQ